LTTQWTRLAFSWLATNNELVSVVTFTESSLDNAAARERPLSAELRNGGDKPVVDAFISSFNYDARGSASNKNLELAVRTTSRGLVTPFQYTVECGNGHRLNSLSVTVVASVDRREGFQVAHDTLSFRGVELPRNDIIIAVGNSVLSAQTKALIGLNELKFKQSDRMSFETSLVNSIAVSTTSYFGDGIRSASISFFVYGL